MGKRVLLSRIKGIGTALLRHHHQVLDQAGTPSYLEASTRRACALYLRHGYHPTPSPQFRLPGDGPPMFPMARPAAAPATG